MKSSSSPGTGRSLLCGRRLPLLLVATAIVMAFTARVASAVNLKLGDILVAEPGTSSVSVVDASTGTRTEISSGGLLAPANKTVGVALAADGDVIAVNRALGLIRVNPLTGAQSILSQGNHFRDPWAIVVDKNTGFIYVADSGYDYDRPTINEAGKIIRVDPVTGAQTVIASGSPCTVFPANAACQNTTTAGSYLSHPYGIAIDYSLAPGTLVVADMSAFNGKGAIVRIQPIPNGTQTLLWGPSTASPAPQVAQASPLSCPMGVAVEPNGNVLVTTFTFPVPTVPTLPVPSGTFYGCTIPGVFRVDLTNNQQTVLSANAPAWQPTHAYAVGAVVRDQGTPDRLHRVVTAGVSQTTTPAWNPTASGTTLDGTVVWQNVGRGENWLIPFGVRAEPVLGNPSQHNIVVGDEGHSMLFRLDASGALMPGGAPLVSGISNVPSIDLITFTPVGGFKREPSRSNGQPTGMLAAGTTQATLSLTTDLNATCRYATSPGLTYSNMPNTFTTTGSTTHSRLLPGLVSGNTHSYYVRCQDTGGNVNSDDFLITFSVARAQSSTPIAAFGFDEGAGSTVFDNSGNGNHGVLSGPTWTPSGRFGNALSFDGINDLVTVVDSVDLDLTNGMTLEAWVYPTANGGGAWRNVLMKERSGGEVYNLYANMDTNVPGLYAVMAANPGVPVDVRGSSQLPLNTWTHLATTFDGSTLRFFVNGSQVESRNVDGPLLTSSGALRIGGNSIWGEFFQGRIDEVRIYNRALSSLEVLLDTLRAVNGSFSDNTPPTRGSGQPSGTLAFGTTQTTISLTTGESATCRYSTQAGVSYGSMSGTFTTTGQATHSRIVSGLSNGGNYTYNVRCIDQAGNANTDDFPITFSVASALVATSSFVGVQNPLTEGGLWDSPGTWADLQKSDGAFTTGLNAAGRAMAPALNSNQYSEITFDQDPGSSTWVGVTTRMQSATNGSGYLAIAYAGEVRLYRVDDFGSVNFTMLASASANIGAAPRRLRLESDGNVHRVYFNNVLLINHLAVGTLYSGGQPGVAASVFGGPQVKILTFVGGNVAALPDTTPPVRSNGQPAGTLQFGTTQATLALTTSETATCRYSTQAGVAYGSMPNTFTMTGSTTHSRVVTGLVNGNSYSYYVRCVDTLSNANTDDFLISFTVSNSSAATSQFVGTEGVLSEGGLWDSPGSWADLQKSNGAYTVALNAQARLVTPAMNANQYSEITYDQDPGASSWVGVTTRTQSAANGSGYLAIVYAGEVRLYRSDDAGGVNFTLLASASASLSTAPRRLRLESQENTHRVYFNGTLLITHTATGTLYTTGQPGIAASVFGGPVVKILSFEGGSLGN